MTTKSEAKESDDDFMIEFAELIHAAEKELK